MTKFDLYVFYSMVTTTTCITVVTKNASIECAHP